jgi:hypothetical protein
MTAVATDNVTPTTTTAGSLPGKTDDPREKVARRLLTAAAKHSLDPEVELDWDAPALPGVPWLPERRSSLYGTPLWEAMTPEQRVELTRQEVASMCAAAVWFETMLMQMLLRHAYDEDQRSQHVRHALTEIAEECRHSMMFAKILAREGVSAYGPGQRLKLGGRLLKTISDPSLTFAGALYVEEYADVMQREAMHDEGIQPLWRHAARVHVIEEARHVRFAREELARTAAALSWRRRLYVQLVTGLIIYSVTVSQINPKVYGTLGLDITEAQRQAAANPNFRQAKHEYSRKVLAFLREQGLITPLTTRLFLKPAGLA